MTISNKKANVTFKEIMDSYVQFHKENVGAMRDAHLYKEIELHMILFAYLQHIVNGEGCVRREFAVNDDAADVILEQNTKDGSLQREVIEVKVYRPTDTSSWPSFVRRAQEQLALKYLTPLSLTSGYLIIWNQKASKTKDPPPVATATTFGSSRSDWTAVVLNGVTIHTIVLW